MNCRFTEQLSAPDVRWTGYWPFTVPPGIFNTTTAAVFEWVYLSSLDRKIYLRCYMVPLILLGYDFSSTSWKWYNTFLWSLGPVLPGKSMVPLTICGNIFCLHFDTAHSVEHFANVWRQFTRYSNTYKQASVTAYR